MQAKNTHRTINKKNAKMMAKSLSDSANKILKVLQLSKSKILRATLNKIEVNGTEVERRKRLRKNLQARGGHRDMSIGRLV